MMNEKILAQCCEQLYKLRGYQVVFIDNENHCINSDYSLNMVPPYCVNLIDYFTHLYKYAKEEILQSPEGLYYLRIAVETGYFVVGPVLVNNYSVSDIKRMYKDRDYDYLLLKSYYKSIQKQPLHNLNVLLALYKNIVEEYCGSRSYQQELQLLKNEDIEMQSGLIINR